MLAGSFHHLRWSPSLPEGGHITIAFVHFAKYNSKSDKLYRGDVYELAEKAGYFVSREGEKFNEVKPEMSKVMSFGAENDLVYAINAREKDLRLADFVRQAISQLDNPNGFFIMAEGGKIDWLCHANDAGAAIIEVIDFDNAVSVALDFARKHPAETLIVVTGDHETGGLTYSEAAMSYYFTSTNHTSANVPIFAMGAGPEKFKVGRVLKEHPFCLFKPDFIQPKGQFLHQSTAADHAKSGHVGNLGNF